MIKGFVAIVGFLAMVLSVAWGAASDGVLEIGKFSSLAPEGDTLPAGWKPLTFKKIERHTVYRLVRDGDVVAIKAVSEAASSGLIQEIKINPKEYPVVQWRWKIGNVLRKGDVTKKSGDDYPARLYITFEYDPAKVGLFEKTKYETIRLLYGQYPPLNTITYIWEGKAPKGLIVPNPYTDRAKMIVVESGTERLNTWVTEERNVYEDYQKAFGEVPPLITGVAIMTDTDNTGESATAYYGDIVFKKR